jgi:hypothetical protein
MVKFISRLTVCVLAVLLAGCAADRDPSTLFAPDDVGTLVVDGLLLVGEPLAEIRLSRAARPDQDYDPLLAAETGATVVVTDLDAQVAYTYSESPQNGRYTTSIPSVVFPERTYELRVTTTAGEQLYALTTTPPVFDVAAWLRLTADGATIVDTLRTYDDLDTAVYFAPENQVVYNVGLLEARFTRPAVPAFQVGIESLDLDSTFVIDPDFFSEEDFASLNRTASSPALEATDNLVRLPWLVVFYTGRYKIRVVALDNNSFDFVRTAPDDDAGFAFGGNAGDSFQRPIFHVEGGIGLFGSIAADSVGIFVKRP